MSEELISLKEAAKISGYTPDYIGQLIRSGKIRGEKVFCQITWMTTANDVLSYKNNNQKNNDQEKISFSARIYAYFNRLKSEFKFLKIFLSNIKAILPIILFLFFSIVLLTFFILDIMFSNPVMQKIPNNVENYTGNVNNLSF